MTDSANLRHSQHAPREPLIGHPMALGAMSEPVSIGDPMPDPTPEEWGQMLAGVGAGTRIPDATIEAAAKRAYESWGSSVFGPLVTPWFALSPRVRDRWLAVARAVLVGEP